MASYPHIHLSTSHIDILSLCSGPVFRSLKPPEVGLSQGSVQGRLPSLFHSQWRSSPQLRCLRLFLPQALPYPGYSNWTPAVEAPLLVTRTSKHTKFMQIYHNTLYAYRYVYIYILIYRQLQWFLNVPSLIYHPTSRVIVSLDPPAILQGPEPRFQDLPLRRPSETRT